MSRKEYSLLNDDRYISYRKENYMALIDGSLTSLMKQVCL